MGDFFGKKSKGRQTATMNEMNEMIQKQVEEFKLAQVGAQQQADRSRSQYQDFDFTNPFADATNPYAGLQTSFDNLAGDLTNVYAGAENVYAGAKNVYAGAQNTYADLQNQFAGMENKYEGMENRFEDMTVDMRAANFQSQQGQQQRANIMQGLRGAAGSSGIAGLAQSLANQGQLQSQQIAAGIGQQERQNQMMAAQEGSRIDQLQRGAGMQLQQAERAGAAQLQSQQAAGAMQAQQMIMGGAAQQQQMRLAGAAEQQRMVLGGEERLQGLQLQGAERARGLGIDRENLSAQGDWMANMAVMEGDAAVQAAEASRLSTLLGMDYGMLAGANAAYQGSLANQMSGMGMKADMYGAQSKNNMFGQLVEGAKAASGFFTPIPL